MTQPADNPANAASARAAIAPFAVAIAIMVVWGGTPLFSKLAATEIDPLLVGELRTVIAGVLAIPILLVMRLALPESPRLRWTLAYSGFAAFVAFPLLFTEAQATTSALHGALILATLPVFTSLFGTIVERRKVTWVWVAGCALALAGEVALIVVRSAGGPGGSLVGDALVLLSAVICSTGYVAGARLAQAGYSSLGTTLWGVAGSAVALAPLTAWSLSRVGVPHASVTAWGSVLVLAVLTSIVGYIAWYWALARGGISRIAGMQFTQPIFGMVLAALVLHERPAPLTLVAAVAILAGAAVVQRASQS